LLSSDDHCFWKKCYHVTIVFVGLSTRKQQQARNAKWVGKTTELYKFAWNASANNSRTVYHTDLRLGDVVYLLIFYKISIYQLFALNGFEFIFCWRDSGNQQYPLGHALQGWLDVAILLVYKHWHQLFFVIQICQPLNKKNSHCMDLCRWQNAKYRYMTFQSCVFHCILNSKKFSEYEIIGLE
jgi:hypothetical protein